MGGITGQLTHFLRLSCVVYYCRAFAEVLGALGFGARSRGSSLSCHMRSPRRPTTETKFPHSGVDRLPALDEDFALHAAVSLPEVYICMQSHRYKDPADMYMSRRARPCSSYHA